MKKKWISALVCMAMVLSLLPATAFAEEASVVTETGEKTDSVKEAEETEKNEETEKTEETKADETESAEEAKKTEAADETEQQPQLSDELAESYSVMAQKAVAESTVSMGTTTLEDGGMYVPAEGQIAGPSAEYRVVDKFVPTEDEEVPESGNYVEYNNGTLTVHGNVAFTSGGPSILNVASGTLTVTGGEDTSLTLNNGSSYAVSIGSSDSSANLVLAGYVDFTAEHTGDRGTAISINGDLKTAEGYSGDISISAKNNIVFYKCGGNSGIAQIDLKTSGSVKMGTNGSYPILSADSFLVEGSSVVLDAPNANPMLQVSGNLSITATEGNLAISSVSTRYAPIINSNKGTVTLSAPKGDITIKSAATGNSYPSQAIYACNIIVNNTGNFTVNGKYVEAISTVKYAAGEQVKGTFTATNCHSVNIENTAENSQSAVSGNVNITGDGSEDSQAVFVNNGGTAVAGDAVIKNFGKVNITSSTSTAINSDNNVDIEDCGSVRISGKGSRGPAIAVSNNADFKNCKNIEISAEGAEAVISNGGKIAFENCDSVSVYNNATNRNAIAAYNGTTTFTGCKYVSVKTEGNNTSAIYGDKYTCDGKISITEKGTTKVFENGEELDNIGGDVTKTGLNLDEENLPTEETTYIAGSGTITFIPAENGKNAKLVLDNAEIKTDDNGTGIFFNSTKTIDVEINGTNKFSVNNGILSNGAINISGDGTLTVEGATNTVRAYGDIVVNSGKIIANNCKKGLVCIETGNITVNGGTLELSIREKGLATTKGDITINNGTVKIAANDNSDDSDGIHAYGETNTETNEVVGGNVYIHGGTVNIDVNYDAITAYNNIEVDGNAKITATSGESGIRVNEGNVNIGESAQVTAASTGEHDGINIAHGDININGNAKLTAAGLCCGIHVSEGNIKITDGAEVIATSEEDGIYGSNGTIDINGNARVTATGDDEGIYANNSIVKVGGSAEVTATGDYGIYAATSTYGDKVSIIIGDNARVTAKGNDGAAIYTRKTLEISGNAVVTADGADGEVDIEVNGCTVSDSAKLNALVQTDNDYTAYGVCDTNNAKSMHPAKLEIKAGAEFTVNAGTVVSVNEISDLTLDGKLINEGAISIGITDAENLPKGKIENNGQLILNFKDTSVDAEKAIKEMKLTGTGIIGVPKASGDEDVYTNAGKKLNPVNSIDLSDENLAGDLDTDGYHWDKNSKTLTLKDGIAVRITDSLTDDVTINTQGDVVISALQNTATGKITITGDVVTIMNLYNRGDIVFKNTTATVNSILKYQEPSAQALNNDTQYSYGVTLINSNVTVGGGENAELCANKITMDNPSVLTLKYAEIKCDAENGLDGIKDFLPKDGGYKIGLYTYGGENEETFYTILDANDNIVKNIVLKKQSSGGHKGSSGGGGFSAKSCGITVKAAENGKVEANKKSASENATITLTVTADEGYQLDKLTVLDSKNGTIALTDQNNGKFEFKMPDSGVTVEATFVKKAAEEEKPETKAFADVPADAWFKKAVDYVNGKGLMSGVDENNFGPELLTNRAMLVTILWRMEGCPTSEQATAFKDIKATDYFYNAVLWAAENKIVSGVSETSFAPNDSITREQLAAILYRYAAYKGYDVTQGGMAVREFSDYESISGYARGSVAWAVNAGIVSGKGNNTLDPSGVATRAEVASMLMRFCENIAK